MRRKTKPKTWAQWHREHKRIQNRVSRQAAELARLVALLFDHSADEVED